MKSMVRALAGRPTVIAEADVTSAIKATDTFVSTMVIEVEFRGFRLKLANWTTHRTALVRREGTHGFYRRISRYKWMIAV